MIIPQNRAWLYQEPPPPPPPPPPPEKEPPPLPLDGDEVMLVDMLLIMESMEFKNDADVTALLPE